MGVQATTTTGTPASVAQVPPTVTTTGGGAAAAPTGTTAATANARTGAATTDYASRLRAATSFDAKNAVFFDAARKDPAHRQELWKTYFASLAPGDQKNVLRFFAAGRQSSGAATRTRTATTRPRTAPAHPTHGRSTRTGRTGATRTPARTTNRTTHPRTARPGPASGARSAPSPRQTTSAPANPGPTAQERADLDRITSPYRFNTAQGPGDRGEPASPGPSRADLDRVAREAAGGGGFNRNPLPAVGRGLRGAYRFFQKN